jgi:hypothetical protein
VPANVVSKLPMVISASSKYGFIYSKLGLKLNSPLLNLALLVCGKWHIKSPTKFIEISEIESAGGGNMVLISGAFSLLLILEVLIRVSSVTKKPSNTLP